MSGKSWWSWSAVLLLTACLAQPTPPAPLDTPTASPTTVALPTAVPPTVTLPVSPTVTLMAAATVEPSPAPVLSTVLPTLTETVPPTETPVTPAATAPPIAALPQAYETDVTVLTYDYTAGFQSTAPDDPVYPYPRLDFSRVGPPVPQTYRALVLENDYVALTVLPELGGRLYRWLDKTTGRELLYQNPVVKPTSWGYRGWWLAAGGVEWAFPVEEHGLNEWRPWQSEWLAGPDWRGLRLWDTDDHTGLQVEVTLRLYAGRSDLIVRPRISNPTAEARPFQFWSNAMVTVNGGGAPSGALRFWLPTGQVTVHSTGDGSLPGPGGTLDWPLYNGRDFSRSAEWHQYLGLFATQARGAVGLYDEAADQGLVRTYPPEVARGVKLFGLGDLPASLYTDGESRYMELWGGYTRTFWDYATLPAGGAVAWEERWYPVSGIGGLGWADPQLAAGLTVTADGVVVGLAAPAPVQVRLVLWQGGTAVAEWTAAVGPGVPFRQGYAGGGSDWRLEVWLAGALVAQLP